MLSMVTAYVQSHYLAAKERLHDDEGATAVEYGLMVALIAVAIIVAVTLVGTKLSALFTGVAGKIVAP